MRRKISIIMLCLIFGGLVQANQAPLPLSLQQCMDLALKNNVQILVSRARQRQAEGRQEVLRAGLLPQIDAMASQQRTWWENIAALGFSGFGVIGPFNTFSVQVMVSQRVLDFSALAHAKAGQIKAQSAKLQIELASQQVILATGLAYIQALEYQDQFNSSIEDVRLAQRLLDLSQHQLDAGLASAVDVARERTQLAQQKARQEQLRLNVVRSLLELKRLIKLPLSQPIVLTDVLRNKDYPHLDQDLAMNSAMDNRMEIRIASTQTDYTLTELKASRRERWPKVDLTAAWGEQGLTPSQDDAHVANAMVSVSLPIWDGGRIHGDVQDKEGLNEQQTLETEDLHWKIEEDVRLALETLISSRAQVQAEAQVEEFARKELDLARDRFSAGLGDNIQLINAQDALADAKDKYDQALGQYTEAQLNYFGALGRPEQFKI